jgi:hypothetical protein
MVNELDNFLDESFIMLTCTKTGNYSQDDLYETILKGLQIKGKLLEMIEPSKFSSSQYFNLCLTAIRQNGMALEWVNESNVSVEHYQNLCNEAAKQNGFSLYYVKQDLFKNEPRKLRVLYNIAAHQNTDALQIIQDQNLNLCLIAAEKDAFALQWINPTLFSKEEYGEICYTAFYKRICVFLLEKIYETDFSKTIRNHLALRFVDKNHLYPEKYRDICIEAIKYSEDALPFVDESLWLDEDFCNEARKRWKSAEKYFKFFKN